MIIKNKMLKNITQNRRAEIIEIAAKLFKIKGFTATTMRDIAEQVGMEAASMYNHIKSKDEILQAICFKISNEYISQLNTIENQIKSPVEKIKELIRLHVRIIITDINSISVANNEWKHLSDDALTAFKEARRDYEQRFAKIIEAGIAVGELQPINLSVALFTILSAVRWVELWYKNDREISPKILEENIISLLMNGLQKHVS